MRKISKKRARQLEEYSKVRLQFVSDHELCERCGKPADEVHHKGGRSGERINDVKDFMSICRPCHIFVHNNPKISREKGWLY